MTEGMDFIERVTDELGNQIQIQAERKIRLQLRPRPWWLPERLWKTLLRRLLMLEETPLSVRTKLE